jgi:hypothetical protein
MEQNKEEPKGMNQNWEEPKWGQAKMGMKQIVNQSCSQL